MLGGLDDWRGLGRWAPFLPLSFPVLVLVVVVVAFVVVVVVFVLLGWCVR